MLQRFTKSWVPVTGFAGLVLLGVLLSIHNHPVPRSKTLSLWLKCPKHSPQPGNSWILCPPSLLALSPMMDKVNRDLDRTAEFSHCTLP